MKKLCKQCNKEVASHFFVPKGICIPCAVKNGESVETDK